ncbi:FAD-dependent monooxygenase [Hyphomicrobium sp. 99]|uniref:FAD-dependent monooxygenase n=1 Tax=Hyphomicrobium sp. 99 TaxID=1163419 RepID=UPI0005F85339|nr:FAD-dependent monooxygenase [Hyphomicrobium sp. 99]
MAANRGSALIAGAGIGGLAAAIALAGRGIDVRVCERRSEFPEEGAGIQIGPNGSRILRDLGVAEFLESKVATPDALSVRDGATGRELTRLPLGHWIAERHGAPYWTAHRRDLHVALRMRAEAEPRITIVRGTEIVSFENEHDGIRAITGVGETLDAQLLVAADGLWSGLREQITGSPNAGLIPVGKTAFRSVVPAEHLPPELVPNAVHIWLSAGTHVVHYPVNAGRDIALVVIANDAARFEGWDSPIVADIVKSKVSTFAEPLRMLVDSAANWRKWSLYRMPELAPWTSGRAALLGDAAHPVLPFLAQGAVMALEDAITLAIAVASRDGDVEPALREYERARRTRVAKVAEASERNGRIYHMKGPAALARNAVMKLTPPARVMTGFDWLYGWKPGPC